MPTYKYLIIGGGMTADSAVRGIRDIDGSGSIGMISSEAQAPYNRPPLSKALWKGEPIESIWRKTADRKVSMHLSRTAKQIMPKMRAVIDNEGIEYTFEKLLLATGGRARQLPSPVEGVIYFRTLADYHRLRALTEQVERFVVIGGGFIGSEIAAALAMNKKAVTMVFPENGIGARAYPRRLSEFLNEFYQSKGVTVLDKESVTRIERKGAAYLVKTASGREIMADAIVAGLGILPNIELAQSAGLRVENGIVVDAKLRTSHPDIFAAGDVANFHNAALDKRLRVEHEDNAITMGEIAGKNMAGAEIPYIHLPFFYSDMFELGYEAIGELDAQFQIVEDWKEEFKEGIVYYLRNERVRGVLLWNTWGQIDHARRLIGDPGPFTADNLTKLLPR